ncbi:MAG: hypothetical protein K2H29_02745 [Oscillospiraceae bacterium]|nr:hypothetical protein [Oscillospiraceae bacterium]
MKKKYKLFDLYECYGTVGYYDTMQEVRKAIREWNEATDGECNLIVMEWSEVYSTYCVKRS